MVMEKEQLKARKNKLQNKLYHMMIEIIFIFGGPAAIAFFVGRKIDAAQASGRLWTLVLLGTAFIISWIILISRVRKIGKELKELEQQIKADKLSQELSESQEHTQ